MRPNIKKHKEVMELENIIEALGDGLRLAHTGYVAESGRLTPKIEWALQCFKWYCMKVHGVWKEPNEKAKNAGI